MRTYIYCNKFILKHYRYMHRYISIPNRPPCYAVTCLTYSQYFRWLVHINFAIIYQYLHTEASSRDDLRATITFLYIHTFKQCELANWMTLARKLATIIIATCTTCAILCYYIQVPSLAGLWNPVRHHWPVLFTARTNIHVLTVHGLKIRAASLPVR